VGLIDGELNGVTLVGRADGRKLGGTTEPLEGPLEGQRDGEKFGLTVGELERAAVGREDGEKI